MSEFPGPPAPPAAPWPQPPPPPPVDSARWGSAAFVAPPPDPPRLAPGRQAVVVLAWVVVVTAWVLGLGAAYTAVRAAALPPGIAGTPELSRGSIVLVGLAVLLGAVVIALERAMRTWLRAVRDMSGAASVREVLGPVAAPAFGTDGPLPSIRRHAVILRTGQLVAVGAVAIGLVLWLIADAPLLARAGIELVAIGAGVCILAVGFLPAMLRGVERREHLAAPPDPTGRRVALPGPRRAVAGVAAGLGALSLVVLAAASVNPVRLALSGCWPEEGWTCRQLTVPAVPGSTGARRDTVDLAYAVRPADAPRPTGGRRVLLIAVGGPGSSGIAEADWYAGTLPLRILETHDVVLFDARGTGATDWRGCPDAYREYVREETTSRAKVFASACIGEAGADGMDMRRFGTAAVVEDVEAIRTALGVETMAVYGSSYGTVVAQAYAAEHPARVSALILDAPVDRQLGGIEVWQTAARGFGDVLEQTFRACDLDEECRDGLADPAAAWERLERRLDTSDGLSVVLPDGSGTPIRTVVSALEVMGAVRSALYDSTGRTAVLRALAAADQGDDRLLARLVESGGDQAWWPEAFAYYATWCADVRVSPTDRVDDAGAFEQVLRERSVDAPGGENIVRTLMPCLYWPVQPTLGEEPADPSGVPTLIVSATADPITPNAEARALHDRIDGSRLVEVQGGGHVSFGSSDSCVDDAVTAFVMEGRSPPTAVTRCESWVADRFVPLTPYGSRPVDVPWSIAVELLNDPLYAYWDGRSTLVVPCLASGLARISTDEDGVDRVVLEACAMDDDDPPADGSGTISWYAATAVLGVRTAAGSLDFTLDGDGVSATGTWDGRTYGYSE